MEIIELFLDDKENAGIEAISIVENPAIEEDFIALNKHEVQFKEVDKEKRILMGAALVPNKQIYRKSGDKEFYVFFSKDTVRKASELFFKKGNQSNSTLEHKMSLKGLTVVESWIVEDGHFDKSRKYNLNVPVGTWMISMKVDNDKIWKDQVKNGQVKGFSIEGYFADKVNMSEDEKLLEQIKEILKTR